MRIDIFDLLSKSEERRNQKQGISWVNNFKIKEMLPCYTTPGNIRIVAQADNSLDDVIPIIFLKLPPGKTTYAERENALTLKLYDRLISLFPSGKVTMTNTKNADEAKEILQKIKVMINEAYSDFLKRGKPTKDQLKIVKKITWMDIYQCLPQTNCGQCGESTCTAFAVKVLSSDAKLAQCSPLRDQKYSTNMKNLKRILGSYLLQTLGWK